MALHVQQPEIPGQPRRTVPAPGSLAGKAQSGLNRGHAQDAGANAQDYRSKESTGRQLKLIQQDIRDHIEVEAQDNIARRMSPAEARYVALRKFANVTRVKEETREVWTFVWLEQPLRYE